MFRDLECLLLDHELVKAVDLLPRRAIGTHDAPDLIHDALGPTAADTSVQVLLCLAAQVGAVSVRVIA